MILGLIMMAATKNVETYAAAQVFYWVGFNGMSYVLDVFIADTSSLRNRALVFAFSTTPYIATTFAGPSAAQDFYKNSTWQWAFGAFAIITPAICLPIILLFGFKQMQAKKQGLIAPRNSGRSLLQSLVFYYHEFDCLYTCNTSASNQLIDSSTRSLDHCRRLCLVLDSIRYRNISSF